MLNSLHSHQQMKGLHSLFTYRYKQNFTVSTYFYMCLFYLQSCMHTVHAQYSYSYSLYSIKHPSTMSSIKFGTHYNEHLCIAIQLIHIYFITFTPSVSNARLWKIIQTLLTILPKYLSTHRILFYQRRPLFINEQS